MYSINAIIGNNYNSSSLYWIDKNEPSTNNYTANTNVPNILVMTSTGNYDHSSVIYTGLLNVNDVIRIKTTNIGNLIASVNHTLTITLLSGII